jgi:pullulanase/glycogen debranching enzyme
MRDSLVRTTKDLNSAGWCTNSLSESKDDQKRIVEGIKGTTGDVLDPNKVLNYASCHDNRTLFDRVNFDGITEEKLAKRISMLANSIVLTSNGISFILAGEEFYRTKGGSDNSYNLSFKINELDYSRKLENLETFKNYQKLIHLKQTVFDLSLNKDLNLLLQVDSSKPNVITYDLDEGESKRKYKVIHVNGYRTGPVVMNLKGYSLYLDTINSHKELSSSTALIPYETLIAYK